VTRGGCAAAPWILPCLIWALNAHAEELAFEADIGFGSGYSDNVNLSTDDVSAPWLRASPAMRLRAASETTSLGSDLRLTRTSYIGRGDLDNSALNGNLTLDRRFERLNFGVDAGYTRDLTTQSELDATGILLPRAQRRNLAFGGRASYALTERLSLSLNANRSTSSFGAVEQRSGVNLVGSTTRDGSLGLGYLLAERWSAGVSLSGQRFETEDGASDQRTRSVGINTSYQASERIEVSASVSRGTTDSRLRQRAGVCPIGAFEFCQFFGIPLVVLDFDVNSSRRVTNYDLEAAMRFSEQSSGSLSASRSQSASGLGALTQTRSLSFAWAYEFDDRLRFSLGGSVQESALAGVDGRTSRLMRVDPSLVWRLDEDLSLTARYGMSRQTVDGSGRAITGREIGLTLEYSFKFLRETRSF
jgi:hypothetical protein